MTPMLVVREGWLAIRSGPGVAPTEPPLASPEEIEAFAVRLATLSRRERETLRLRAEGLTVDQIADRCYVSGSTVKEHLRQALSKLDLSGIEPAGRVNRACYLLARVEDRQQCETSHGSAR